MIRCGVCGHIWSRGCEACDKALAAEQLTDDRLRIATGYTDAFFLFMIALIFLAFAILK